MPKNYGRCHFGFFQIQNVKITFHEEQPSLFPLHLLPIPRWQLYLEKKNYIYVLRHHTNTKTVGELHQKIYCFHFESYVQGFDDVKISCVWTSVQITVERLAKRERKKCVETRFSYFSGNYLRQASLST
jgi:hypothetical protein